MTYDPDAREAKADAARDAQMDRWRAAARRCVRDSVFADFASDEAHANDRHPSLTTAERNAR